MAFEEPPKRQADVDAVFARGTFDLTTKSGCGTFTEAVVWELELRFPGQWKHLKSKPPHNNWNGHKVDAILHPKTGYAVDIIVKSESPQARPGWDLDEKPDGGPRYKDRPDLHMEPFPPAGVEPEPEPEPGPEPQPDALKQLREQMASLEARLTARAEMVDAALSVGLHELSRRISILEDRPAGEPAPLPELVAEGNLFGYIPVRLPVRKV